MKSTKAHKRLTHEEDLVSEVMERYPSGAPDIQEKLQEAKAAVSRAKDAVKMQESSEMKSAGKTKKATVKVRREKGLKRHRPTKRDFEGASHHLPIGVRTAQAKSAATKKTPPPARKAVKALRSEEHTSELQSPCNLVCRFLLE